MRGNRSWSAVGLVSILLFSGPGFGFKIQVEKIPGQAEEGFIEIHGVGSDNFSAEIWEAGRLHFLPDYRSPLIRPKWDGVFRNIYAPSVVPRNDDWRVFYGAWDGSDRPNDRLYSIDTPDFLTFHRRRLVIENGPFIHVCNSHAIPWEDGGVLLAGTAYPVENGLNKPIVFTSPDGEAWNGEPAGVYTASPKDLIPIGGYPGFEQADNNGANVFLEENGKFHFYFFNFKDAGKIHHAVGGDPRRLEYQGVALEPSAIVNDVKRFEDEGQNHYLMGLHRNGDRLFYSLSVSPASFSPQRELFTHLDESDLYIVALGWVTEGNRLLGVLYGAGASPALNRNRIFARWLQKKIVLVDEDGREHFASWALGPDRQMVKVPAESKFQGTVKVYGDDGVTLLGETLLPKVGSGEILRVKLEE
ncbi:MAG: hypothetical protein H6751_00870 [Candidatus Omnitrophica bacterium]|nr:hypothetical protein [Candidatus Omnitrophota bacterium]